MTNSYAFYAANPLNTFGSIANAYGLYLENVSTGATSNYAIYSAGGKNYFAGNVGIGTTTPGAKLTVAGAIVAAAPNTAAGSSLDLATGNTQTLDAVGGSTITLSNFQHGGQYTIVVRDTTSRTYTFPGCTSSYFKPANGLTITGTRTIYGIQAIQNGANWECYIAWGSGFQ
jgi:hypothetical protein